MRERERENLWSAGSRDQGIRGMGFTWEGVVRRDDGFGKAG